MSGVCHSIADIVEYKRGDEEGHRSLKPLVKCAFTAVLEAFATFASFADSTNLKNALFSTITVGGLALTQSIFDIVGFVKLCKPGEVINKPQVGGSESDPEITQQANVVIAKNGSTTDTDPKNNIIRVNGNTDSITGSMISSTSTEVHDD